MAPQADGDMGGYERVESESQGRRQRIPRSMKASPRVGEGRSHRALIPIPQSEKVGPMLGWRGSQSRQERVPGSEKPGPAAA